MVIAVDTLFLLGNMIDLGGTKNDKYFRNCAAVILSGKNERYLF